MTIEITGLRDGDYADWRRLFEGYATFYKRVMTDAIAETVWGWLHDPTHVLTCLAARGADGRMVGFAHIREMPRPSTGSYAGFLDDLFVDPALRGTGVVDALFEGIRELALEQGWSMVRWMTADDNYRARGVYDRVGRKTSWNLYEMDCTPAQPG